MKRAALHDIIPTMKRIIPFLLIFCSVWSVWAVEIKEQELEKTADTVIEFFNYVGPHEKIETDEEIRNIGAGLSRSLPDGVEGSKVRRADFAESEARFLASYQSADVFPVQDADAGGSDQEEYEGFC